jgi:hypothetical protein
MKTRSDLNRLSDDAEIKTDKEQRKMIANMKEAWKNITLATYENE